MKNVKLEKILKSIKKPNGEFDTEKWRKLDVGTKRAINCYEYSREYDCIIIKDMWEIETEWTIDCLRACGIKEIVFAETSTEATKVLRRMLIKGCRVTGVRVYKTIDWRTHIEEIEGIVIEL